LAETLKKKLDVSAELIEGAGGVFDVHVNDTQIWNKEEIGRFPEHDEILKAIASATGGS
jgi:selT/selW/selH-like putative selenoprotein